jgi:predicted amidohydrolase
MVRVALAQFSGHESKHINVQKAENLARQAAGNGARIICFPELCTTCASSGASSSSGGPTPMVRS